MRNLLKMLIFLIVPLQSAIAQCPTKITEKDNSFIFSWDDIFPKNKSKVIKIDCKKYKSFLTADGAALRTRRDTSIKKALLEGMHFVTGRHLIFFIKRDTCFYNDGRLIKRKIEIKSP